MKNDRPILIIVSPGFPENEADSTCLTSQQLLIKAFKKRFPELILEIVTLYYPFFKGNYTWNDNTVRSFNGWKLNRISKLMMWFRVWKELKRIKSSRQVIGILSFWATDAGWIADRFARRYGLTHYCWICGQDARKENRYARLLKREGSTLVAMSDFLRDEFYKNHKVWPAYLITNGIDPSLFAPARVQKTIDILGVGSLIPLKQYDLFIKVLHRVKLHFPELRAVLCGKGPEFNTLFQLVESLGLSDNIIMMGAVNHQVVLDLMQRSRLLLHPSSYEGFSTCCLEALYAGAQVVSFCKPMNRSISNWHIATNEDDMFQKTLDILNGQPVEDVSSDPFLIEAAAVSFKSLFDNKVSKA